MLLRGYIPARIVEYAFRERIIKELRLFLWLKYTTSGVIKIGSSVEAEIAQKLDISERTVSRHLRSLIKLGWISVDRSGNYFIRGWDQLSIRLKLKLHYRVEISDMYFNKNKWRGYVFGVVTGYYCKLKQVSIIAGRKKDRSTHAIGRAITTPLSLHYLAGMLNYTFAAINNFKSEAVKYGFIRVYKDIYKIEGDRNLYKLYQSGWEPGLPYPTWEQGFRYPNWKQQLLYPNSSTGYIVFRYADIIKSLLHIKVK
jgi:DNA-binding transcriptional ArsR family regulator